MHFFMFAADFWGEKHLKILTHGKNPTTTLDPLQKMVAFPNQLQET